MINSDPVLIIGYRRSKNLSKLISLSLDNKATKIYISLDNVDKEDSQAILDHKKCLAVIKNAQVKNPGKIICRLLPINVGCAVGVITACDWFFSQESFGIILEDDCFPSIDFFEYVSLVKQKLLANSDIWLICGTQILKSDVKNRGFFISKYALTWGWATSKNKWLEISHNLRNQVKNYQTNHSFMPENSYWYFGAQRAELGLVDVWDTILLHRMHVLKKKAILPFKNLVTNVGYDERATHTKGNLEIRKSTGQFEFSSELPLDNCIKLDLELKREAYGINSKHIVSNRIRRLIDIFFLRLGRISSKPLRDRLIQYNNFS